MIAAGLVLAAGAGRRMGMPKALLGHSSGEWLLGRSLDELFAGGCASATAVLGAEADRARRLLEDAGWLDDLRLRVVVASDWDDGMSASLRAGLSSLQSTTADLALVTLVDLPDVGRDVHRRLLGHAAGRSTLLRATYAGRPGHPVLLGRDHWSAMAGEVSGDDGGRHYLGRHDTVSVECEDLASGRDLDRPTDRLEGPAR